MRFLVCKVCFWFQRISKPLPRGKIVYISLLYFQKLNFFVCLFIHLCVFERFGVTLYGRQRWYWKKSGMKAFALLSETISDFGKPNLLLQVQSFCLLALGTVRWVTDFESRSSLHTSCQGYEGQQTCHSTLNSHWTFSLLKTSRKICP